MRPHHIPLFAVASLCAGPASAAARAGILKRDVSEALPYSPPGEPTTAVGTPGTSHSPSFTLSSRSTSSSGTWPPYSNQTTSVSLSTTSTTCGDPGCSLITVTPSSTTTQPPNPDSTSMPNCIPVDSDKPATTIKVTYTATTTFYGNSTDYTPPYPSITTPGYCFQPIIPDPTTGTWSNTAPFVTRPVSGRPTVTFITTDKNPSVVFSPGPTPDYSGPSDDPLPNPGDHQTVPPDRPNPQPKPKPKPKPSEGGKDKPTHIVKAGPGYVAIGTSTFAHLQPHQTTVVTVGRDVFTIFPTAVVGGGSTVTKPAPVPPPTDLPATAATTSLGGLPISASDSVVYIGDHTLAVPSSGTKTVVDGHNVALTPGTVVVDSTGTLVWAVATTDVVVAGADLATLIGPTVLVIHSTTITYGPGIDPMTTEVGDDTITVGPGGVVLGSKTLGGPGAAASDIAYEVVGGVTITKIGSEAVVISSHTYPITSGAPTTTTTIGQDILTIGPDGVSFNSMTVVGPGVDRDEDDAVTATVVPEDTASVDEPAETAGRDDDDDAAPSTRPGTHALVGLCVAISIFLAV